MTKNSGVPGKTVQQLHRAVDAVSRKALNEHVSPEAQLTELDSRPGAAVKERARLEALRTRADD